MVEVRTNIAERLVEVMAPESKGAAAVARGFADAAVTAAAATGAATAVTQIGHGMVSEFSGIAPGNPAALGVLPKPVGIPDRSQELEVSRGAGQGRSLGPNS